LTRNEFQGKVALVTGGTTGIGRAAAVAYAREGAKVVVAGRRADEGEETVRLVRAQGREALFVPTDVAQEAQVKNLIGRTLELFGRLDCAFNNAGIEQVPTPFLADQRELPGSRVVGLPRDQVGAVALEVLQQGLGVGRVILSAAAGDGLAVALEARRVERVEH
jgi:NAD(P)-dependent dehydrogenase (short-subunit alcohol dehydrogenase family)